MKNPENTMDIDSVSQVVTPDALALLDSPPPTNRPDISRLPDAVVDGRPVFDRGDKIVIERYASVLSHRPYLDTKTYRVVSVNEANGDVALWDDDLSQFSRTNYKTGVAAGYVFKLAKGAAVSTKRKRGRPRKNPVAPVEAAPPPGEKKKRGRPKGSKNRSKEEIAGEKALRHAKRAAKRSPAGRRPLPAPPPSPRARGIVVDPSTIFIFPHSEIISGPR